MQLFHSRISSHLDFSWHNFYFVLAFKEIMRGTRLKRPSSHVTLTRWHPERCGKVLKRVLWKTKIKPSLISIIISIKRQKTLSLLVEPLSQKMILTVINRHIRHLTLLIATGTKYWALIGWLLNKLYYPNPKQIKYLKEVDAITPRNLQAMQSLTKQDHQSHLWDRADHL